MLPRNHPDRIRIAFDDHRLVANAGLGSILIRYSPAKRRDRRNSANHEMVPEGKEIQRPGRVQTRMEPAESTMGEPSRRTRNRANKDRAGSIQTMGATQALEGFSVQVRLLSSATLALTEPPATPRR